MNTLGTPIYANSQAVDPPAAIAKSAQNIKPGMSVGLTTNSILAGWAVMLSTACCSSGKCGLLPPTTTLTSTSNGTRASITLPVTLSGSAPPRVTSTLRAISGIWRCHPQYFKNSRRRRANFVPSRSWVYEARLV